MLTEYLHAALEKARYRLLDDGTYYGNIPGFDGVWADAKTLERCREELQEVLEEWILLKVHDDESLPVVNGKRLRVPALTRA